MEEIDVSPEAVKLTIFATIRELNRGCNGRNRLQESLDSKLFGVGGSLDSLGLVSLIVAVEERVQEEFGMVITLADERAMSRKRNPFETIGSLVEYICELLIMEYDDDRIQNYGDYGSA